MDKQNNYTLQKTELHWSTLINLTLTTIITVLLILILEFSLKNYTRRNAYAFKERAVFLRHFVDGNIIEDILGLTDSDDSSSDAGVFEGQQPFVLELHDLVKDNPAAEDAAPVAKVKKHRKKRRQPDAKQDPASDTSSSVSESSVPPSGLDEHNREEFYDAHESYHGLTENQAAANPVVAAGLMQARSEHGQAPKTPAQQTAVQPTTGSGTRREPPTTITKPTNPQ